MPSYNGQDSTSHKLAAASATALERGDGVQADELAGVSQVVFEQENEVHHAQEQAKANAPVIEVWGGYSQSRERER